MSAADGYVMSSAWEGMPMVLLEAAAAGLPIVSTAVGGNREVVADDESGFLVPPRDADALARGMARLGALSAPELRAMGERGRERVRSRYGLARVADRWEALYREMLARKGAPAGTRAESPSVADQPDDVESATGGRS
jgi:glycosyltransferase involved in cell wall biosynthesis